MHTSRVTRSLFAMAAALVLLNGCGGSATKIALSAEQHHRTVIGDLWNPGYGWIVVGPNRHALYMFCVERPRHCSGGQDPAFSPLIAHGRVVAAPAAARTPMDKGERLRIKAGGLGTVMLNNGERQVTYFGHRLYFYRGDQQPGDIDIRGESKQHGQGHWLAVDAGAGRIALSTTY